MTSRVGPTWPFTLTPPHCLLFYCDLTIHPTLKIPISITQFSTFKAPGDYNKAPGAVVAAEAGVSEIILAFNSGPHFL